MSNTKLRLTLGDRILLARRHKGWRLDDLTEATGITGASLSRYESNKQQPTVPKLIAIAKALGMDPNELLGWGDLESNGSVTSP